MAFINRIVLRPPSTAPELPLHGLSFAVKDMSVTPLSFCCFLSSITDCFCELIIDCSTWHVGVSYEFDCPITSHVRLCFFNYFAGNACELCWIMISRR